MVTLAEGLLRMTGLLYDPTCFDLLRAAFQQAEEDERTEFFRRARALPYREFLKTVYWGTIRGRVYAAQPRCEFCGTQEHLTVHHRNYDIRGDEHNHLDQLIVLCRQCHGYNHGLSTPKQLMAIWNRKTYKRR